MQTIFSMVKKMLEIQNNHLHITFQPDLIYHRLISIKPLLRKFFNQSVLLEFDDLFNETYIQIHTSIMNLRCLRSFNSWSLRIFLNHSHNFTSETYYNQNTKIEDFSENIICKFYLDNCMENLKEIERLIIIESVIYDQPLKALSLKFNISYNNIRILKYRALKKIRNQISSTS